MYRSLVLAAGESFLALLAGEFELQAGYCRNVPTEMKGGLSKGRLRTVIIIPGMLQ